MGGELTPVGDAVAAFNARLVLELAGYPVWAGDLVEEPVYTCQFCLRGV
jgi:hypothetical protein